MTFKDFIRHKYKFTEVDMFFINRNYKHLFDDFNEYLQAEAEKIKVETEMKDFKFRQSLQPLNTDEGDE